nr:NADH dehydrogenase subunit 4L [Hypoaspis sp. 3 JO-2023a]
MFLGELMFFSGLVTFIKNQKHVLMILLSMELMMMGIFFFLINNLMVEMYEMIIFFFVMVVSEACLGLSMMVLMVMYYGSDLVKSYTLLNF